MYLPQNVDGVEIDVHVRRGAGVADTEAVKDMYNCVGWREHERK